MNRKGCRASNRTRLGAFAILWLGAGYDWLALRQACQISGCSRRQRSSRESTTAWKATGCARPAAAVSPTAAGGRR